MSSIHSVHIGPYADWQVTNDPPLSEELDSLLLGAEIGLTFHYDLPGIWTPFFSRDAKEDPPRRFGWGDVDEFGSADLIDVDRQAEVEWFRTTFKEQIDALSRHYGKSPTFHWGIVSSYG